jgi:hypothetical protein
MEFVLVWRFWASTGTPRSSGFNPAIPPPPTLFVGVVETGAFSAITTITSYSSDRRLKENFRPLEDALNKVSKLNGCTFDWKQEECNQYDFWPETIKNEVGLIAQEVEDVLPQAVCEAPFDTKDENGVKVSRSGKNFKTIQYEKLIPLLVEAIKELRNQVEELRNK